MGEEAAVTWEVVERTGGGGRNETHTHGAAAPEDTRRYTRRLSAQLSSRFFKSPPLFKIEKLRSLSASFTC